MNNFFKIFTLSLILQFIPESSSAQLFYKDDHKQHKDLKLNSIKFGPYLELEKGRYTLIELGLECQWKKLQLTNSKTHGINFGLNYSLLSGNFGYDLAYWMKPKPLGFTFGGTFSFRSDLNALSSFGFAPNIGFKFWWLHLQTGYYLWSVAPSKMDTNTFFIGLRFTPITKSKKTLKRGNKKVFGD